MEVSFNSKKYICPKRLKNNFFSNKPMRHLHWHLCQHNSSKYPIRLDEADCRLMELPQCYQQNSYHTAYGTHHVLLPQGVVLHLVTLSYKEYSVHLHKPVIVRTDT